MYHHGPIQPLTGLIVLFKNFTTQPMLKQLWALAVTILLPSYQQQKAQGPSMGSSLGQPRQVLATRGLSRNEACKVKLMRSVKSSGITS